MKHKINIVELNVDFIGEQNQPLTEEEQHKISAFIQKQKKDRKNTNNDVTKKRKKLFM